MTSTRFRRSVLAVPAFVAVTALVACGSDDNNEVVEETTTETTATEETNDEAAEAPAGDTGEVSLEAAPTEDLSDGDIVTVDLQGLDPSYGYYVGICGAERPEGSPAPECTGGRDGDSQAWLSERGTTQIPEDGTVTVELTASAEGEGIDCRTDACVLKVFGDHTEGFEDVVEVPVTFAS